jgi:hypothetical protein
MSSLSSKIMLDFLDRIRHEDLILLQYQMAYYRCSPADCIQSMLVREPICITRRDSLELQERYHEQNDEKDRKKC